MPRPPRTKPRRAPRQSRAEDTVRVLLDATEIVMAKRGFHAATTNRIARAAGVGIGTLYRYFPTQEALVEAVVHRMWSRELEALASRAHLLETAPLELAVKETVGALCKVVAANAPLYQRWYSEASHLGRLDLGLDMSARATELLRAALEKRAIRPADPAFAADLVVKTAVAVVRTGARDWPKQLAGGQLAEELSSMIVRYLVG
jgi:AcrR family transcriptional regulator